MKKKQGHPLPAPSFRTSRTAVQVLLVLASLGAGYLLFVSLSGSVPIGCGEGSSCDDVLASRWAYWFGVPVSASALALYFSLLVLTFFPEIGSVSKPPSWRTNSLLFGASAIIAAAVWFLGLQVFVLRSFCKFCLATHAAAVAAACLILKNCFSGSSGKNRKAPGLAWTPALLSSVAVWVALALGQTLVRHPVGKVALLDPTIATNPPALAAAPPSPAAPPARPARVLRLHGGRFQLNADELPTLGSTTTTNLALSFFDYTCRHCREMHGHLRAIEQMFAGRLAFISLPMPLDTNCNLMISSTPTAHLHACQYARLALAVWRARREVHAEFDDWLFTPAVPPSVDEARAKAESLVGSAALEAALRDPWIDQQIQRNIELYVANARAAGGTGMPQLVIGNAVSRGPISGVEELAGVVRKFLNL